MEGLIDSLARFDKGWLVGIAGMLLGLSLMARRGAKPPPAAPDSGGWPDWTPRPPPIWLTGWRRPKRKRQAGVLNSEHSRELFRYHDRVAALASVRPLVPENHEVLDHLKSLFSDLSLHDETQPALEWALAGQYRRALGYVVRLARWSERSYVPPPTGVMIRFGPQLEPGQLYSEAGVLAYCLSDKEAAFYFEKARAASPSYLTPLLVLRHIYEGSGHTAKLRSVMRDLIAALELQRAGNERSLAQDGIPGKAALEIRQDIQELIARIASETLYLERLTGKPAALD